MERRASRYSLEKGNDMTVEKYRKYIGEMVGKISDEARLERIYRVTHKLFIRDRSEACEWPDPCEGSETV